MLRKALVLALAVGVVATVPALAKPRVSFSFASDDNTDAPTFTGFGNSISAADVLVDLKVDHNDDLGGGLVVFPSTMVAGFYNLRKHEVMKCGSAYLHVWKASGRIDFFHRNATFLPLLTIGFVEGTLTSLSPSPNALGETMTLQVSEGVDPFTQIFPQTLLEQTLLITPGYANLPNGEDLAFTFTRIRAASGLDFPAVDLGGNFTEEWSSEGSFSASADP